MLSLTRHGPVSTGLILAQEFCDGFPDTGANQDDGAIVLDARRHESACVSPVTGSGADGSAVLGGLLGPQGRPALDFYLFHCADQRWIPVARNR
jgi:hypothetical protein